MRPNDVTLPQVPRLCWRRKLSGFALAKPARVHDFRRLINDKMAALGISFELRSRTLHNTGHLQQLVNTVYSSTDIMPECLQGLEIWERGFAEIVKNCEVSSIRRRQSFPPEISDDIDARAIHASRSGWMTADQSPVSMRTAIPLILRRPEIFASGRAPEGYFGRSQLQLSDRLAGSPGRWLSPPC